MLVEGLGPGMDLHPGKQLDVVTFLPALPRRARQRVSTRGDDGHRDRALLRLTQFLRITVYLMEIVDGHRMARALDRAAHRSGQTGEGRGGQPRRVRLRPVHRGPGANTGRGPIPGQQTLFPVYEYHPFITDRDGDLLELEAEYRRHAKVQLVIRDLNHGMVLSHLPTKSVSPRV